MAVLAGHEDRRPGAPLAARLTPWLAAGAFSLLIAAPPLAAQSLGYELTPAAERVHWDDDLAFEDDWLYGARLGLLFGHQVELQPYYFFANDYPIDAARAGGVFGASSVGRTIDVRHYGANLQLNLGRGDIVPFLRGGGGILQLRPDSGERRDRIAVTAGGGVRFAIGGATAELYAEQMALRLNPKNVFGVDSTSTGVAPTQRNIVYGAAISLPLSSMSERDAYEEGLQGSTAPIEPFVGQLRYASKLGLEDQDLAGVRAGIDFSPQVGLRGFYWRGVNDDHDGTDPVAGYGGEVQLNLNSGPGISPFLVLGAGRIDYHDDFRDPAGNPRDDEGVLIAGGGASVRLTDRLRLNASVRDYIMTPEATLTDVATTDDLTHNTLLSAGLTISIGGSSGLSSREVELRREREALDRRSRELAAREREAARARDTAGASHRDSLLADSLSPDARRDQMRRAGRDEGMARGRRRMHDERTRIMRAPGDSATQSVRTDSLVRQRDKTRWMTVPVPVVGEVILRYGVTPADSTHMSTSLPGVSTEELRRLIREELQRDSSTVSPQGATTGSRVERQGMDSTALGATQFSRAEQARLARIEEMEAELQRRLDAMQALEVERRNTTVPPTAAPPTAAPPPARRTTTDSVADAGIASVPVFQRFGQATSRDLRPFAGVGGGNDLQGVLSLRADLGPLSPGSGFRFAPELALGFGGGSTSVLALANVQYPFGSIGGNAAIRPYVTLGGGIFSPSVLAVNTAVGASFALGSQRTSPLYTVVELQGLNLFDYTRLMIGVSSRR